MCDDYCKGGVDCCHHSSQSDFIYFNIINYFILCECVRKKRRAALICRSHFVVIFFLETEKMQKSKQQSKKKAKNSNISSYIEFYDWKNEWKFPRIQDL